MCYTCYIGFQYWMISGVSSSLTDFFSCFDFKHSAYFILADREAFIIYGSMVIVYGVCWLFASIWPLIFRLEIIVSGDMLTWIRLCFWLKPRSTGAWPWLSVKIKVTTDASFLNLETQRVSKYSSCKRSSFGNSINFLLNFMTLPFRNSLNFDIASSQHFLDRTFNCKICVRTIFDLGRLLKNGGCGTERDRRKSVPKGIFSINLETIATTSCWHFFLNLVSLAFETRSAVRNFLRVVSTLNPKSILSS